MIAPHIATNDPMISNLSGFFLSIIIPHMIDEMLNIPYIQIN
jgi:hypothetical protein